MFGARRRELAKIAAARSTGAAPLTGHGKPLASNVTSPRADPRAPAPFLSQRPSPQPSQAPQPSPAPQPSQAPVPYYGYRLKAKQPFVEKEDEDTNDTDDNSERVPAPSLSQHPSSQPSQAPPLYNAIRMAPLPDFSQMGGESYDRREYYKEEYEKAELAGVDDDWEPTSYQPQRPYSPSPEPESQYPDPQSTTSTPVRMTQTQPATLLAPEEIGDSQSQVLPSTQAEVEAQLLGALRSPPSVARSSDTSSVVTAIYNPLGSVLGKRPSLPGEEAPGPADRAYVEILHEALDIPPRSSPRKDASALRKKVRLDAQTQTPSPAPPTMSSMSTLRMDLSASAERKDKGKGKAVEDLAAAPSSSIPYDPTVRANRRKCMADGNRVHRGLSSSPVKGTPAAQKKFKAPSPLEILDSQDGDDEIIAISPLRPRPTVQEPEPLPLKSRKKKTPKDKGSSSRSSKKTVGSTSLSDVEGWIKSEQDVDDFVGITPMRNSRKVDPKKKGDTSNLKGSASVFSALECTPPPQIGVEEFLATGPLSNKAKARPISPLSKRKYSLIS